MAPSSTMAPSSSAIPPTSASNEISQAEEDPIQIQNPKVNGSASKSLSQDQNKKKHSFFTNPLKMMFKNPKTTKENTPNPQEEAKKKEEEAKKKEEEAKKKEEERTKEIDAITKSIKADFHSIEIAEERIEKHREAFKEAQKKLGELKDVNAKDLRDFKKVVKTMKQQISSQDKTDDGKEEASLLEQLRAIATANKEVLSEEVLKMMPNLFFDSDFEKSLQFQDFKEFPSVLVERATD